MKRRDYYLVWGFILFLVALGIFEVIALFVWAPGTFSQKFSALFTVLGVYGIAIAFLSRNKAIQENRFELLSRLTATKPSRYIQGNIGRSPDWLQPLAEKNPLGF